MLEMIKDKPLYLNNILNDYLNTYKKYFDDLQSFTTYDTIYYHFLSRYITKTTIIQKINFLIKYMGLQRNFRILDIGCGPGIYSNILTKLGYNVVGIDKNNSLLIIAKKMMCWLNIFMKYRKMNMENMRYVNEFDRAILIGESFAYLNVNIGVLVLKNIYNALRKDGLLCIDFINRNYVISKIPGYQVFKKGCVFLIEKYILSDDDILYIQCSILKPDNTIKRNFSIVLYNMNQINQLLNTCGFKVIKISGDSNGKPLKKYDKKMIIIAKKV